MLLLESIIRQKRSNNFVSENRGATVVSAEIEVPLKIRGEYRNDYDIVKLHRIIVTKLFREYCDSSKLLATIEELKEEMLRINDRRGTVRAKQKLRYFTELYSTTSDVLRIREFMSSSDALIAKYKFVGSATTSIDVMNTSNLLYEPTEDDIRRIDIIEEYMTFAKKYIDIQLVCTGRRKIYSEPVCVECERVLSDILPGQDGLVECPVCFSENFIIRSQKIIVEHPSCKSDSEDTENFIKALSRYQGKSVPSLVIEGMRVSIEDVTEMLDKYFTDTNHPTSRASRQREIDMYGVRRGTSINIMLQAMKEIGLKCYCDVYYVCQSVWGWRLPDLSEIECDLIEDYKITQRAWCSMPSEKKDRESSLPISYRTYQHLRRRRHPCKPEHFKIPRNTHLYNEIWKYMCENCGDPNMKFVPL